MVPSPSRASKTTMINKTSRPERVFVGGAISGGSATPATAGDKDKEDS